jgi:hypothetical protein
MSHEPEIGSVFEEVAGGPPARKRRTLPGPLSLLQDVALGIGDAVRDAVQVGKQESHRAHDEAWEHFDDLTKRRRELAEKDEQNEK